MKETTLNNKNVLLEALEYIDRDLIAETVEELKAPPMRQAPERDKCVTRKSIKYTLLLAACLVLVSAIIPVVNYVLTHFDIFPGGLGTENTSEETTETETENTITPIYEHDKKAPYPIFAADLEPISEDMIKKVKEAWYQKVYSFEYNTLEEYYADSNLSKNDKDNNIITAAKSSAEYYSNIIFSSQAQDHYIGRYYGIKENCVIFAINTHLAGEYNVITIADIQIHNDNSFYILVYKDGEIKTLEDAYSAKWLTYNSIERIEVRHKLFNSFAYWKKAVYTIYNYAKFTLELEDPTYESIEAINSILLEKEYTKRFANCVEKDQTYKNMYDQRTSREKLADQAYSGAKSVASASAFALEKGEDKVLQEDRFRYYGTFGEKIIWANYSDMNAVTEFTLAGYNFFFANTAEVNVYINDNILSLKNAYNQGLITDTEIAKLHERYLAYEEYLDMMRNIGDRIGDAFVYGKYDGAIVFGQTSMMALYDEESVAGCIFKYSNGVGISVYKNGELYGLYNAYNSGILSDEQIKDIWRKHEINVRNEDENFEENYIYGDYLNPIKGLEPLTKTGIDEANAEWASLYPEYVGKLIDTDKINRGLNYRYLGTISGYNVFWVANSGEAETKTIQGYEFSYSSGFDIILVKNNKNFDLIEEGQNRGFYESRIALIYERNKEYEEYFVNHQKIEAEPVDIPKPTYPKFTPDLEDLTRQQMYDIRDAYANYRWLEVKDKLTTEGAHAYYNAAWNDLFGGDVEKIWYLGIIDNKAIFIIKSAYGNTTENALNGIFCYSFDKRKFTHISQNPLNDNDEDAIAKLSQRIEAYNKYLGNLQLNQ